LELEEELKVVGNNMKSLEISEQEVSSKRVQTLSNVILYYFYCITAVDMISL